MKKEFFECDFCKKKAHEEFPQDWIHLKTCVFSQGNFSSLRLRDMPRDLEGKYLKFFDLTFCSFSCLIRWFGIQMKTPITEEESVNPSSKLR